MELKSVEEVVPGVIQREFTVRVAGEAVPGVLWTPAPHLAPRAVIAMGHGGSQHKKSKAIYARAIHYAMNHGWATLAIDAPQHGERISPEQAALARARTLARINGVPNAPAMGAAEKIRYLDDLAARAVPEWQAALDAIFAADFIEPRTPTGYWGVSQGSSIGIPLLATEKRFKCAVLGLAQLHPDHHNLRSAAQQITIPLRFAFQWDDAIREREYGLALFDAFGSPEKSMHINPGGHNEIPASEIASWERFFAAHLGSGDPTV